MKSEWPVVYLGEYCLKIGSGATPKGGKSVYLESGSIALIRSQNIYNEGFKPKGLVYITAQSAEKLSNVEVQSSDVLLNITGDSVARVCLAPNEHLPARVNQHVAIIRPNPDEFDARFIRYFLTSPEQQELLLIIASAGATRNALTKSHIESLEICKPDLQTQRHIANQLHILENKIQLNNSINQSLEQLGQAIFKSWFVDFEPVKAKIAALEAGGSEEDALLAAMQTISGKDAAALAELQTNHPDQFAELRATAELFPSAMQDSELGEIPVGWESIQMGECLDIVETGARPKGGVSGIHEGVPSVGAENIIGVGNYNYGKEKFVSVEFFEKLKRGIVENLDCLLYKDGGKPGDFRPRVSMFGFGFPYEKFAINEHVFRLRSSRLGQAFLYFQIAHERVLADLRHKGAKAAIPGINQTDVKSIWLTCPSANILNVFNKKIESLLVSILIRSKENLRLSDLRDTLLPKLISGELSVTDADTQLYQVANN